jgi:nicotinate-nucleotide pyrophosphorylase (carboxylating)
MNSENSPKYLSSRPSKVYLKKIIKTALKEDIGRGDITSKAIVPANLNYTARLVAKENGIIAGLEVATICFELLDSKIRLEMSYQDGDRIERGAVIGTISGSARAILAAERTALNFLQRMSGIATHTRQFVDAVKNFGTIILDTRKTVPGLRLLDKWAVELGGGHNHRFGLHDMVMIKENHIAVAGGISPAIEKVRNEYHGKYRIVVEVKDLTELEEAILLRADQILLDNMKLADLQRAVQFTAKRIPLEASGNVTLDNASDIAETGVDYISIGAITHSIKALDISLLLMGTI